MFEKIKNKIIYFLKKTKDLFFFYVVVFKRALIHYVNLFNLFSYIERYKKRNEYLRKLKDLDEKDKKIEERNNEKLKKFKEQELKKKKLKLEKEKISSQEKRISFLNNFKGTVNKELSHHVIEWVDYFGVYSYKSIESLFFKPKKKTFFLERNLKNLKKLKSKLGLNDSEVFLDFLARHNERHQLLDNPFYIDIKWGDRVIRDALLQNRKIIKSNDREKKEYREFLDSFRKILVLKTKIYIKKKKKIAKKKNFLAKVLRVLLYVEDREAENLNEQLAKTFFYTHDVNYNFRVRSSNIKVRSLEWTIPSPPPLHTFYVPVRTIVTNDRFFNYKKGKRLIKNEYYNFKETPSVFQKLFRKFSKTFFLSRNYIYYCLGFLNLDKYPSRWYSGSHNVNDVEEYSHTVEYVSQSIRYPYKHLSKHLPFSAGLHNNTVSVDLLITSDKSNKVLFGEKKSYLSKPVFVKKKDYIEKPLFVLGDRNEGLCKVFTKKIENTYHEFKLVVDTLTKEIDYKGDGCYTCYYLPSLKKNNLHNFMWLNRVFEKPLELGPAVRDYNKFNISSDHLHDKIDLYCLSLDLKNQLYDSIMHLFGGFVFGLYYNFLLFVEKLKSNKSLNFFFDCYDQIDFSWSLEFFYFNFYVPYMVSKKMNKKIYFFRYFFMDLVLFPVLGLGFYRLIKSEFLLFKYLSKKK